MTDERGRLVDSWRLAHSEQELTGSLQRLVGLGTADSIPVGIEARTGLIVVRLLAAGHSVVPIHPNAFHAARPRWGGSRAKSDAGDAAKLAEFVRTELGAEQASVRVLVPTTAATVQVRTQCRTRADLQTTRLAAANQLDAVLAANWPGPRGLFDRLDCPIGLAFLDRYPTPGSAGRLTVARIESFLRRNGYSGKKPASELLARLRHHPTAAGCLHDDVLTGMVQAHGAHLRALLPALAEMNKTINGALTGHPNAGLFAALPRTGKLNLAQVVGEVGPILVRADNAQQVTAEAGVAPVTHESGTRRHVVFLAAVNARQALTVRGQQPTRRRLGSPPLRHRARSRQAPPTCHPDPRPCLGPSDLAMLEEQHPVRPGATAPHETGRITHQHTPRGHALRAARGRRPRAHRAASLCDRYVIG